MKEITFGLGYKPEHDLVFSDDIPYFSKNVLLLNIFHVLRFERIDDSIHEIKSWIDSIRDLHVIKYIEPIAALIFTIEKYDGMKFLTHEKIDGIKKIITELHFLLAEFTKIKWVQEKANKLDMNQKGIYVRYGNVELRVIENYIRNKNILFEELQKVVSYSGNSDQMYRGMVQDAARWISAGDVSYGINTLMTNAGFYCHQDAELEYRHDLELWCFYYLKGLSYGNIFLYQPAYPWFLNVWKGMSDSKLDFCYKPYNFPNPQDFFESLKGKTVLIVSPFKQLIDKMISENRLQSLYRNFIVSEIDFLVVEAPISTYPNRPGFGFADSFNKLKAQVSDCFASRQIDVFIASCGCYGIPICTYAFENFGCVSIYYGNWLNTLLGIRQGSSSDWGADLINDEYRLDSDLSKFKNVHLIDQGRYV